MDEWKNDLTSKQLELLKKLLENVKDVLTNPDHDDFFVHRYLKARKYDVKKAEEMLRNSLRWRQSYGADDLYPDWEPPEVLRKYWPGGVFGHGKEGHPILWQLSKDFDARSMVKCVKKAEIVKYHIWRMEKVMHACKVESIKRNRRIQSAVHISDLDGFHLGMVFLPGGIQDAMKQSFALFEANYPENLHSSYVINAPSVFPAIFNILKPLLSEETKRKVHILGRDWKEELLKVVDLDQLPVYWGGTAMDPDEKCTNHINHGCTVPQKYFISEQVGADRTKMTTILVIRGNTYNLSYDVKLPGTVIKWIFETDDHDISFGVLYAPNRTMYKNQETKELVKKTRYDSHVVPQDGTLTCESVGVYILQFDNTYSWVNSKTVHYEVEVLEPDEELFADIEGFTKEDDIELQTSILESTHL